MFEINAELMERPSDMSLRAEMAWEYFRINDTEQDDGYIALKIGNAVLFGGNGGEDIEHADIFKTENEYIGFLERFSDERLRENPSRYLIEAGTIKANFLSEGVEEAILAVIEYNETERKELAGE